MEWEKRGLIFNVDGSLSWNKTHAQVPVAFLLDNSTIRIYYSTRNFENKSSTSFIDVNAENPQEIKYIHNKPILELGSLGSFDESGIMPSSIVKSNDLIYLFYIGWSIRTTVPYHNSIGLAFSKDNGVTFEKAGYGPLFDSTLNEPFFTGTSNVFIEDDIWHIYYLSCIKWEIINDKPEPFYNIKYANSVDGINWKRNGKVAIELNNDEAGLASASVMKDNNIYKMWYCFRKGLNYRNDKNYSYRIGYAESLNLIDWIRKDSCVGIEISEKGWDSEMIAYPNIIKFKDKKYMFYNGNGFGKTGFGYAILKE
jgi:hypothetical protein